MSLASRSYRRSIVCEHLEDRCLLSGAAADRLHRDFDKTKIDVVQMQLGSHVTMAEFQALQQVVRSWNLPPYKSSLTSAPDPAQQTAAFDLAFKLDYCFVNAGFTAAGWAQTQAAITADLQQLGFNVPQSSTEQAISDMEAIAQSAGVTVEENHQYFNDADAVLSDLSAMRNPPPGISTFTYFSHHVRGFIHG
jgi:hypothetical protein